MTKEDFDDLRDELVDKHYAEDAMCKSDLFDLLNDYDKLLETAHNSDYAKCPNCDSELEVTGVKCLGCDYSDEHLA